MQMHVYVETKFDIATFQKTRLSGSAFLKEKADM